MSRAMNYDYRPGLAPPTSNRPHSQLRERIVGSARDQYDLYFNENTPVNNIRQVNDLSKIKINDLLNHKRGQYAEENDLLPTTSNFGYKSNSVRNTDSDRNSAFINKAFQMEEFLRLRDEYSKLEIENKQLTHCLELRDRENFVLNEKVVNIESDRQVIQQRFIDEITRKDKIIQKLK
jgi:predicted nuclease of restriction endonuclease-like (RecB) superfamily